MPIRVSILLVAAMLVAMASAAGAAPLLTVDASARTRGGLTGVRSVRTLRLDPTRLAALRAEHVATIDDFPLDGARRARLILTRFDPFAPGAVAEIVEPVGARRLALPDNAYLAGVVDGDPDSRVLVIAAPGAVHGFVAVGSDVFPFGPDAQGIHRSYRLRDVDPKAYPPPGDFCANDLHPEVAEAALAAADAAPAPPAAASPAAADAPGTLKQADVAIETDRELRTKFASDQAALDYLASLAAAATAIYERDVAVRLRFSYIRLWGAAPADPWAAADTSGALQELRTYWNDAGNSSMAAIAGPRDVVHFVSGKSVQGGIAYLNAACNASFGYGVSQVYGSFNLAQPSQIWDVLVFTHELGHNFGSPHSHCYTPPIDHCYNQESGCYAGAVETSRGTIMSYCHLLGGGLSNIDLLFGNVVSARIAQFVAGATCLETVVGGATTTTVTTSTSTSVTATTALTTSTTSTSSSSSTSTSSSTTSSTTTSGPAATTTTLNPRSGGRDDDADGIANGLDQCAGSPPGDLVDATGCSVCPCEGPREGGAWTSRATYRRCVRSEVKRLVRAGIIDHPARRAARRHAQQATCTRAETTRCCLADSRCRILPAVSCAQREAGGAIDAGPGSCLPSPCGG